MSWVNIQPEIISVLEGLTKIQEVHNYEKSQFRGYPAITVVPSENESDFEATQERQRVYAFRIRAYVESGSDAHEATGEGTKEADRILRAVMDDIVNEFDKPANARLNGQVLFIEPVPSIWEYDSDRGLRYAEIILKTHTYLDTNTI